MGGHTVLLPVSNSAHPPTHKRTHTIPIIEVSRKPDLFMGLGPPPGPIFGGCDGSACTLDWIHKQATEWVDVRDILHPHTQ